MKTVLALRHAKSSWDDLSLADFDRPLNRRGQAAAPVMGRYLRQAGYRPDVVLCSPALRARQTLALVQTTFPELPAPIFEPKLYNARKSTLFDCLCALAEPAEQVLMIAHNPGLERLAVALVGAGSAAARKRLAAKFPTGGLAVLRFDQARWVDVTPGSGTLVDVTRPKDLVRA